MDTLVSGRLALAGSISIFWVSLRDVVGMSRGGVRAGLMVEVVSLWILRDAGNVSVGEDLN